MKFFKVFIFIVILTPFLFVGCIQENISFDSKYHLSFSCDTVLFDTLLVDQLSPTKRVKIYNDNKFAINISSIKLSTGANSLFRINVDNASIELN